MKRVDNNNLMIFGLTEETGESITFAKRAREFKWVTITYKVNEIFGEINENPRFEAKRFVQEKESEYIIYTAGQSSAAGKFP